MFKLAWKDLRITRIFWLPAAFSYLVFLMMFHEAALAELAVGILMTLGLAGAILLIDDTQRTDTLFAALPVRRKEIVAGRFLSAAFVTAICLILFMGGIVGLRALLGARAAHLGVLLSFRTGLAFVLAAAGFHAVFFPLYFRHGLGKAVLRFLAIVLGASIIFSLVLQAIGPKVLGEAAARTTAPGVFLSVPGLLQALWIKTEAALGAPLFLAALLSVCALAISVSLRLSVRFYSRHDL